MTGRTVFSSLSEWSAHTVRMLGSAAPGLRAGGPSVCIVGSGPAGMQAAASLRIAGFSVTVMEALPAAAATLARVPAADGSSACRGPAAPLDADEIHGLVTACTEAGIVFICGSPAGQAEFNALASRYDFVVYACGRGAVFPAGQDGHLHGNIYAVGSCVKNAKTCTALEAVSAASALADVLAYSAGTAAHLSK